jgi:hypothetical protein
MLILTKLDQLKVKVDRNEHEAVRGQIMDQAS